MFPFLLRTVARWGHRGAGTGCWLAVWAWLLPAAAQAQFNPPDQPLDPQAAWLPYIQSWTCVPHDSSGQRIAVYANPTTGGKSYYGASFTPRGDLKVLVIYAGFTGDNVPGNSAISQNDSSRVNPWPQVDALHPVWGTALPRTAYTDSLFYNDTSQFVPGNLHNNISNVLYQMSLSLSFGKPFRLMVKHLPDRVNVQTAPNNASSTWNYYESQLWPKVKQMYNGVIDWSEFDHRTNSPMYAYDNSVSPPDGRLDYVVVVWRLLNGGPYGVGLQADQAANGGVTYALPTTGLVPPTGATTPFSTYQSGLQWDGQNQYFSQHGARGVERDVFCHELLHSLIQSSHYNFAHNLTGFHLQGASGYGFMNGIVNSALNAWERWYLGLGPTTTGPAHDLSHLQGPQDLNATHTYVLRDFVTTGDAMRLRIPGSDQYLWLENHTAGTSFTKRYLFYRDGRNPAQLYPQTKPGILAMVEDMHTPTHDSLMYWGNYEQNRSRVNGLRPLSSRGNFDYIPQSALSTHGGYIWGNRFYDLRQAAPNPLGAQGDIQFFRWDVDSNHVISYSNQGVQGRWPNEFTYNGKINGVVTPAWLGAEIAFDQVGQKIGMMTNPGLIPHLRYSLTDKRNEVINVHGLSIEIISKNAVTGAMTVQVRYDDVNVGPAVGSDILRWTGDIVLHDNPLASDDINVVAGGTLLLDESGTVNRHTPLLGTTNKFVNPTVMTCYEGSVLNVEYGGKLVLQHGSTLRLKSGSRLQLGFGAQLRLESGSEVIVEDGAVLEVSPDADVVVGTDAHLTIANNDPNAGLLLLNTSRLTATGNGEIRVLPGARLDLTTRWLPDPDHGAPLSGLVLADDDSHLLIDRGVLAVAKNIDFTFGGTGYVTFNGAESVLDLDPTSNWIQSGPARDNRLYEFRDGVSVNVAPASFALDNGQLWYDHGSSLHVTTSQSTGTLEQLDFAGDPLHPGGLALECAGIDRLTLTQCWVHHFQNGMALAADRLTVEEGLMHHISNTGWNFLTPDGSAVVDGGQVHHCDNIGIASAVKNLYLRNWVRVYANGIGVYSDTDGSQLTVGDQGCAWLLNNSSAAVLGRNIHLDIDAVRHEQQNGNVARQINRFDGNRSAGGQVFNICYDGGQLPAANSAELQARGNYWDGGGAPTGYAFEPCSGIATRVVALDGTGYVTCEPTHCGGCGAIPRPANPVAGTSNPAALELLLTPNPAREWVRLTVAEEGEYQYRLLTAQGQTLATGAFAGRAVDVRTAGWPGGVYRVVVWRVGSTAHASQTLVVE